ncbi:MAG TPA: AAA domain-containing protein [Rhizomicrobium sp.]
MRLQDLGSDPKQYFAVLDGGHRLLLSEAFSDRQRFGWLRNLGELGRRRALWEGMLRIAEALSILHGEGTIHRSLSPSSIFVSPEGQGDFRLSGFEWSLRIVGSEGAAAKVGHRRNILAPELANGQSEYSTATDWFDFGLLAAELFGVALGRLKKAETVRNSVEQLPNLRESERQLILNFLAEHREHRLVEAGAATQALRNVLQELSVASTGLGKPLVLAMRLGHDISMTRAIAAASAGSAPVASMEKQRSWVSEDLRGDIRVVARQTPHPHFVLRGRQLEYRVRQWSLKSLSTWDVGFCDGVESAPRSVSGDQYFSLGDRQLEIMTFSDAGRSLQRIRDRSAPWDKVFAFRKVRARLESDLIQIHNFFRITQQLDTVLTAAQICPVVITSVERSSSETEITLTPRDEHARSELARHLRLQSPAEQLKNWFDLGAEEVVAELADDPKRHTYQVLERKVIANEPGRIINWQFVGAKPSPGGAQYRFKTPGTVSVKENVVVYLARDFGGAIAQLRRRHQAIDDMRSHEGLLRLLADPRGVSRRSGDELPPGRSPIPLDESKKAVLEDLWRTQPSFMVQGPPGTGKTTLIKAFVDRLLSQDPSAQVLISAHSHHTVDDVREKLAEQFSDVEVSKRPILLRLGANEATEHDLDQVTHLLTSLLLGSPLAKGAASHLQTRLRKMALTDVAEAAGTDTDIRTLQLLVQDAANLTLTTLNSKDLADLTSRSRRFDWSIIEEAGKAHGFDMAMALQESHRLLLIGDHFQLPPYDARLFKDLLGDPLRVRKAIQAGVQFAPGLIDESLVEDDPDLPTFEDRCAQWRRLVTLFAVLFQRSINTEPGEPRPAATLTDQHRMHPDIANLVGRIFYPEGEAGTLLRSPDDTIAKFRDPPPFNVKSGSWLPPQRIVWCDVPWIQKREFAKGESIGLFSSPVEAEVIVDILEQLESVGTSSCELQILSPYTDQLACIRKSVEVARNNGRLSNVFDPPFDLSARKRVGATVDEFQGSEADIVIVSLVRNNALVPWKSIGFLKEENRMNVLLSRARHKLIVVGSWDFFQTRCDETTSPDVEYAYIGRMMTLMSLAQKEGSLARVERRP